MRLRPSPLKTTFHQGHSEREPGASSSRAVEGLKAGLVDPPTVPGERRPSNFRDISLGEWPRLPFTVRIKRFAYFSMLRQSLLASLIGNGTRVGPTAAIERAYSDRARSGSKGSTRVSFRPFIVRVPRARGIDLASLKFG